MTDLSLAGPWTLFDAEGAVDRALPDPRRHPLRADRRRPHSRPDDRHQRGRRAVGRPRPMGDPAQLSARRPSELAGKWAVLDLEFVDTIADVTVNGKVGRQARLQLHPPPHRPDRRAPSPATTTIAIRFRSGRSPEATARAAQPALPDPVERLQQPRRRPQHDAQGAVPWRLGLGPLPDGARHLCRAEAPPLRRRAHRARGHPPGPSRRRQGDGDRRCRARRPPRRDRAGHLHLRRQDASAPTSR